ncbi:CsbD family protein [Bradyrhizobium sp. 613_E4_N2_2]|uniref:CsbD family protein n=1 Tax=unclassified Bradyrhizobium TaxID=2631580 RepID=UPI003F88B055
MKGATVPAQDPALGNFGDVVGIAATFTLWKRQRRWRNHCATLLLVYLPTAKDTIMDREHVKGAADKAKGAIKEGAGKLTGDKDLEAEGKIDKAKGSAHNAVGDVKDAARDAADALKK